MDRTVSIVIASLLLVAGLLAPPAQTQGYPGSASLFSSAGLTVVYPTTGIDPDVARRSAARRVAHLRAFYGIDASAVADDAAGEEALAGPVLLLGWSNRLLEPAREAGMLRSEGNEYVFLGGIRIRDGEHLLFNAPSPFSDNGWLYFWSRIDPELDRFQVVPFVGSDWAVFEGYRARSQGQYATPVAWPPTRERAAENADSDLTELRRVRIAAGRYRLHHPDGSLTPDQASEVLSRRQEALTTAARRFGAPDDDLVIDLYVFKDAEEKTDWTDVPDPAHSVPRRHELYMLLDLATAANPHEEIHHLARDRWGATESTALYEGVALRYEAPERLSTLAALLVDQQAVPQIADLLDEERLRAQMRSGLGMGSAALLVDWLETLDGGTTLGRFYAARPADADALSQLTGRSTTELQAAFENRLRSLAEVGREEYRFERAFAEARRLRSEGRLEAAIERLTEALAVRPDDPGALYFKGLLCVESEDPARAEAPLRRLDDLEEDERNSRFMAFVPYQLGRMYRKLGRFEEARTAFGRMLDEPDRHDSHRLAREALEALDRSREEPERSGD